MKKYKQEIAVLDTGDLEPQCFESRDVHWRGTPESQQAGVGTAYAKALGQLTAHVKETGHVSFKERQLR